MRRFGFVSAVMALASFFLGSEKSGIVEQFASSADTDAIVAHAFGNDRQSWNTYTFSFEPAVGYAIRRVGVPGGYWTFFTVAELRVFGR